MLSFSFTQRNVIQIHFDNTGISKLNDVLSKQRGSGDHIHLWTPPLGNDLNIHTPFGGECSGDCPRRRSRSYAEARRTGSGTVSVSTHHQRIGDTDGSPDSKQPAVRRSP